MRCANHDTARLDRPLDPMAFLFSMPGVGTIARRLAAQQHSTRTYPADNLIVTRPIALLPTIQAVASRLSSYAYFDD